MKNKSPRFSRRGAKERKGRKVKKARQCALIGSAGHTN